MVVMTTNIAGLLTGAILSPLLFVTVMEVINKGSLAFGSDCKG